MIRDDEIKDLRANQRFLVQELKRRKIDVEVFNWEYQILQARYRGKVELFLNLDSSVMPLPAFIVFGDKGLTKEVLSAQKISVPRGKKFWNGDKVKALEYGNTLGFPCVVKPCRGKEGHSVYMPCDTIVELDAAIEAIVDRSGWDGYIIEELAAGKIIRLFVTKFGDMAALQCEPAFVIGDGIHAIAELADIETKRREALGNCLRPVVIDEFVEWYLDKQELNSSSILAKDQKIYLRANSNIATGGFCEDISDKIHESLIEIGYSVLRACPGVPYCSVDIALSDPSIQQFPDSYSVISVNPVPAVGAYMAPGAGKGRDVAKMIVDVVFPDTRLAA